MILENNIEHMEYIYMYNINIYFIYYKSLLVLMPSWTPARVDEVPNCSKWFTSGAKRLQAYTIYKKSPEDDLQIIKNKRHYIVFDDLWLCKISVFE